MEEASFGLQRSKHIIKVRMIIPSPAATEPMMMAILLLLLDFESTREANGGATGLAGSGSAVHGAVAEGPVQRPPGVYVNFRPVLLNKLCGTYPVNLLPSTDLHDRD